MKGILCSILLIPIIAAAQQEPNTKFGTATTEELKMTVYDKDSAAEAIILFDIGHSVNGRLKRHTRIKVLKTGGYGLADVLVPVFGKENFKNLKASTFNLVNGRIEESKLERGGKFNEELVKGLHVIRFAMPNVRVGSIMEYEYEVAAGIGPWEFQHLVPCKWSELTMSVPEALILQVHLTGYLKPDTYDEKFEYCLENIRTNVDVGTTSQCKVRHWIMKDVPAFKPEPFISNYRNYTSQVKFDVASFKPRNALEIPWMASWKDLHTRYTEVVFFEGNVIGSGFLKKTANDLVEGLTNPDDKVRAIHSYVKKELEFSGYNSRYPSRELKKVMEEKKDLRAAST